MDRTELGSFSMSAEGVLTPCSIEVAKELMADEDSRIVASAAIEGGIVSTAFLPICLVFEDGSPQAFETVVIRDHKARVVRRYPDLADALRGHENVVSEFNRIVR